MELLNADKFTSFLIESSIFPQFVNMFPLPKLLSTKYWQYQSPLSKMWLVFYLESIPDSCESCQQTRKETTPKLLSNKKFIVNFVSLLCFNLRIALAIFYCRQTIYKSINKFISCHPSLTTILHEHCHLSTTDHSSYTCPAHCFISNDTTPENQILQPSILLIVTMIGISHRYRYISLKSQEHSFIQSFILSIPFLKQSTTQIFQEVN